MKGEDTMLFTPVIPTITLIAQLIIEYSTLTSKKPSLVHLLVRSVSLILVYGGLFLLNDLGVKDYATFYLLTAAYLLACLYLFEESLSQKIFLYFIVWGITSFLSSVFGWIAFWIAGRSESATILRYVLYASGYLIIIPVYLRFWRVRVKDMLSIFQRGTPFYALYPVLTFVVFNILFGPTNSLRTPYWFAIMVLFEAIVLFSYYLLFSQIYAVFDRMRAEARLENAERYVRLQKKYYEQIELGERAQRKLAHDTRHHLVAMDALLGAGEYGSLADYLSTLLLKSGQSYTTRYCDNVIANAVIGGYIKMAEDSGIYVSVELDLPQDIAIDDYDLCTVFGNSLENAIEACQRIEPDSAFFDKRHITMKSRAKDGRLILRIENSHDGSILRRGDSFLSSKGSPGGVGIESVRTVVERYNGYLDFDCKEGLFTLSAVLYTQRS